MGLVMVAYSLKHSFPKHEIYGLASQMRRAAASIPSNSAEGAAGRSKDPFRNHLTIAMGSLSELETQMKIACRLGYITKSKFETTVRQSAGCTAVIAGLKNSIT